MSIKTYTADSNNTVSNAQHTYAAGSHTLQMSNNAIGMNVAQVMSTLSKQSIKTVYFGTNVIEVQAHAFDGCTSLVSMGF